MSTTSIRPARVLLFVAVFGQITTLAHAVPWALFTDSQTDVFCDVINAANTELVIDGESGAFIIVRGPDTELPLTFVDDDLSVFFGNTPAGFVDFAEDAEGNRSLWWFTEANDVANVNEFTGEPTETGMLPEDFAGISCDACDFWDEPVDCVDDDDDGLDPRFDLCPDTPLDEVADADGCSCSQLDDDNDGINNCFNLCPESFEDEEVDDDGCACAQLDDDNDGINNCFDLCPESFEDEDVDDDGCACAQLDDDEDEINNCFDLCPGSFEDEDVDDDGCACAQLDDDEDEINNCFDLCPNSRAGVVVDDDGCSTGGGGGFGGLCGAFGMLSLSMMFCGLIGLRLRPARRRLPY